MQKRKRVVLSMNDKYNIITKLEEGQSATNLSNEYGVGKSTITDIKKQKTSIIDFISNLDSNGGQTSRKTMKFAANMVLDDAVYKWLVEKRSEGEPISGPILCEEAIRLNAKLGGPSSFRASTGWLNRFKSRHGIRHLQIRREKLSTDSCELKLTGLLKEKCNALEKAAEETALNWQALPGKTLSPRRRVSGPDFKVNRDRITAFACTTGSHDQCDEEDLQEWMQDADLTPQIKQENEILGFATNEAGADPDHQIKQENEILNFATDEADAITRTSASEKDENIPAASEAFRCLDTALRWFEAQDESEEYQITILKNVRDLAARKSIGLIGPNKVMGDSF